MRTAKILLVGTIVATITVSLVGCSSGSPPSQIPTNVTGTVLTLGDNNPVEGVVVVLRSGNRVYRSDPTGADGTFVIQDVLAPATYAVEVETPAGSNLVLAGDIPNQRIEANRNGVNMGTIYLTEAPPQEPGIGA